MNSSSRKWLRPVLLVAAAVIILVIVLVTRTPDISPNPEELAAMAETVETLEVQSYRAIWSGTSTNRGKTSESYQAAAFTTPDRYHLKIKEDGAVSEFIAIGDTQYIKSSELSPNIMRAFTQSASNFLTTKYSLDSLESLLEPEALPQEEVAAWTAFITGAPSIWKASGRK